jgi:hypothetical protein
MGINANTIYSWKKGRTNPRPKNLQKLDRLVSAYLRDGKHAVVPSKTIKTRSINDILHNGNGTGKRGTLVKPTTTHTPDIISLHEAHWDGFKEGLKLGMEITEDQFKGYGSTR